MAATSPAWRPGDLVFTLNGEGILKNQSFCRRSGLRQALVSTGLLLAVAVTAVVLAPRWRIYLQDRLTSAPLYDGRSVRSLIYALGHDRPDGRRQAAEALRRIGPDAADALPALSEALHDPERPVRRSAAEALGKICPRASAADAGLRSLLGAPDQLLRCTAAEALWKIEHRAEAVLPVVVVAIANRQSAGRVKAAWVLMVMGSEAAEAVPALCALLDDPTDPGREMVIGVLGAIGPSAHAAVPALTDISRSARARPWVRQAAAAALAQIQPKGSWRSDRPSSF